jgi:hypothetical protein
MYKVVKVDVFECTCRFCKYSWRAWELPDRCADCKRPGWNKDNKMVEGIVSVEVTDGKITNVKTGMIPDSEQIVAVTEQYDPPDPSAILPTLVNGHPTDCECQDVRCMILRAKFKNGR